MPLGITLSTSPWFSNICTLLSCLPSESSVYGFHTQLNYHKLNPVSNLLCFCVFHQIPAHLASYRIVKFYIKFLSRSLFSLGSSCVYRFLCRDLKSADLQNTQARQHLFCLIYKLDFPLYFCLLILGFFFFFPL